MITTQHPLRYPLQALVSLGQIYGDVLYYATSLFDHYFNKTTYFRPEAYYFWTYYFFLNFIWIVIPGSKYTDCRYPRNREVDFAILVLLVKSIRATARAFQALEKQSATRQTNAGSKKSN